MRALAVVILLALGTTACGSPQSTSSSPTPAGTTSPSPCVVSATPSAIPVSPSPPSYGGVVQVGQLQTVERHFSVTPPLVEVGVQAFWNQGDVRLSITSPTGRLIDRTTNAADVLHPGNEISQTLVVMHPEAGDWTIHLFGAAVPVGGEQVSLGVTEIGLFPPISYAAVTPDRGVAPLTVQFDSGGAVATNGATVASLRWDFGDCSSPVNLPNPSHVYTAAGNYLVSLTVTDSNGQSDTAYNNVVVTAYNHPPTADFVWGILDRSRPLLIGLSETAKDIDGKIATYEWTFGDGASGSGRFVNHTYPKAGTYPVRLTVTDDGGLSATNCQLVTTGHVIQPSEAPVMCP